MSPNAEAIVPPLKEPSMNESIDRIRVRATPDGRLSRNDAAAYLGTKPKTLAMWALHRKGPRSVRVGGRIFYFVDALDEFVQGYSNSKAPERIAA